MFLYEQESENAVNTAIDKARRYTFLCRPKFIVSSPNKSVEVTKDITEPRSLARGILVIFDMTRFVVTFLFVPFSRV